MSSTKRKQRPERLETQYLDFVSYAVCRECGRKVRWRVRSSYRCSDGRHIIQYLRCPTPGCNGRATRRTDIPSA